MSNKETLTQSILNSLLENFDDSQLRIIENSLYLYLGDYDLIQKNMETQLTTDISPDAKAYKMFFVAKKIEGLSEKSLKYYSIILRQFFGTISKPLATITTDDIRYYFATRQNVSLVTITNERRVLLSFFSWLTNEEYVPKNPVLKIKNIKQPKVLKKPFSQTEIEELRDACENLRDRAIVEVLLSTGMRCNELCNANIQDVDFSNGEITVTGKGNKQRVCYLNAPAKKRLKDYLESRNDKYTALFTALSDNGKRIKDNRIMNGGVLAITHNIGASANVKNTHPHRFRRTAATMALQRGMPVEQVRVMLGHEKIDTTMRYAITADETVKHAHSRYM
jgi:site-specific recombinase XerD